jgi:hypothetical protein
MLRPDASMVDPTGYIAPQNGYAMSFRDFVPHLMNVLDQLGMSIHARTTFIKSVLCSNHPLRSHVWIAITSRPLQHTRTSPTDSSPHGESPLPSTYPSPQTPVSSPVYSSSSEVSPTTRWALSPLLARKRPTLPTGARW